MTTYIALLRAVNLGPTNKVAMADLRVLVGELGFADVKTLLQSGNVVFRGKTQKTAALEQLLEKETAKRLGLTTDYFVRTAEELETIITRNPFPDAAKNDPSHLVVSFMKDAPPAASVKALQAAIVGREQLRADGRHAYIVYPDGIGESKLTAALALRHLKTAGTGRNWNTVLKLRNLTTGA
jgi:uncharacterized protein (DUF1697 family)